MGKPTRARKRRRRRGSTSISVVEVAAEQQKKQWQTGGPVLLPGTGSRVLSCAVEVRCDLPCIGAQPAGAARPHSSQPQRGLATVRDVEAGEVLLCELPLLRWVDSACATRVCAWCMRCCGGAESGGGGEAAAVQSAVLLPLVCEGGCAGRVRWCSERCRRAHEPEHRVACPLIGAAAAEAARGSSSEDRRIPPVHVQTGVRSVGEDDKRCMPRVEEEEEEEEEEEKEVAVGYDAAGARLALGGATNKQPRKVLQEVHPGDAGEQMASGLVDEVRLMLERQQQGSWASSMSKRQPIVCGRRACRRRRRRRRLYPG
jgi:hypothetical protein